MCARVKLTVAKTVGLKTSFFNVEPVVSVAVPPERISALVVVVVFSQNSRMQAPSTRMVEGKTTRSRVEMKMATTRRYEGGYTSTMHNAPTRTDFWRGATAARKLLEYV